MRIVKYRIANFTLSSSCKKKRADIRAEVGAKVGAGPMIKGLPSFPPKANMTPTTTPPMINSKTATTKKKQVRDRPQMEPDAAPLWQWE
jgi:hypothetical protein